MALRIINCSTQFGKPQKYQILKFCWLSSHFQLLSLCNLKCETSGPKGERRWNSRKEEEKVFASKYDLYYKPSWSPLLWGLTKNLFCTWTKSRTNWLRSKEKTRAQLLKKDEKFKVWAGFRKENGSEPALKQSGQWNPFVQTNYCVGKN